MYEREVDGEPVEFGVSGELYNANLLMYDRQTESYWEQISGVAVIGEQTGQRLAFYPSQTMTWREWQSAYPESEVLSRYTGYIREYDGKPYQAYFGSGDLWFSVNALSTQLFAKEFVTGVELPTGEFLAYLERDVVERGAINDNVAGWDLVVAVESESGTVAAVFNRQVDGRTLTFDVENDRLVDRETGSRWTFGGRAIAGELEGHQLEALRSLRLFWFAWVAFHPETELRRPA